MVEFVTSVGIYETQWDRPKGPQRRKITAHASGPNLCGEKVLTEEDTKRARAYNSLGCTSASSEMPPVKPRRPPLHAGGIRHWGQG